MNDDGEKSESSAQSKTAGKGKKPAAGAKQSGEKRGCGRPPKGDPVMVRLSEEERAFATELGNGVTAAGVRMALNAVRHMKPDAVQALSRLQAPAASVSSPATIPATATAPASGFDVPLPQLPDLNDFPAIPEVQAAGQSFEPAGEPVYAQRPAAR